LKAIRLKARKIILLLFLISILLLSEIIAVAADSDVLSIKISDNVRSAFNSFTLSEVADIEGPKEASRIAGMLLFSVPASNTLLREDVINVLQKSEITGVRIELKMPTEVLVEVVDSVMQTEEKPAAEGHTLSEVIRKLSNWKFSVEAVPQRQIPKGVLIGPASIIPGSASVILRFRDNGGREHSVPVRLTWHQPALTLKRSMRRGEIIQAEDIGERSIKVMAPNVYASSPDEVIGKSLRRSQQQGEIVLLSLVASAPTIQRGKIITLFIDVGGMMIESRGEAQQSGSIGDTINVRNLSSKKIVSGIIRAPERVEVLK
jgi:flagella basal body P-ring formation protein FlgA